MIAINTEQTPKEIVYRSKDNGCFHVSSFNDMVLNPTEIGKINAIYSFAKNHTDARVQISDT